MEVAKKDVHETKHFYPYDERTIPGSTVLMGGQSIIRGLTCKVIGLPSLALLNFLILVAPRNVWEFYRSSPPNPVLLNLKPHPMSSRCSPALLSLFVSVTVSVLPDSFFLERNPMLWPFL